MSYWSFGANCLPLYQLEIILLIPNFSKNPQYLISRGCTILTSTLFAIPSRSLVLCCYLKMVKNTFK